MNETLVEKNKLRLFFKKKYRVCFAQNDGLQYDLDTIGIAPLLATEIKNSDVKKYLYAHFTDHGPKTKKIKAS